MKKITLRPRAGFAAFIAAALLVALPFPVLNAQDTSRPRYTMNWGSSSPTPTPKPAAPTGPQYVYANAASVVIRSGVSPTSPIVTTAVKGDKLLVMEEVGLRLKVKTASALVGYVVKLNTSTSAPQQNDGGFGGLLRGNRGAGEQSSGGSVRGLRPLRAPIPTTGTLNLEIPGADNVRGLAQSVTEADVDQFMVAGGITPP